MADKNRDLRAADSDRQRVADQLRTALGEGRLTMEEYDERVRQAYAAKTYGDLDGLLTDLPGVAPASRSAVAQRADTAPATTAEQRSNRRFPGWLWAIWGTWFLAVGVNVVIWVAASLAAGHAIYFWPIWVAGPWGVVLLFSTFGAMAGGDRHRQREAYRRARRERRGRY